MRKRLTATLILAAALAVSCASEKRQLKSNLPDSAFHPGQSQAPPGLPVVRVQPARRLEPGYPAEVPLPPGPTTAQPEGSSLPAPVPPLPALALTADAGDKKWMAYLEKIERYLARPAKGDLGYLFRMRASLDAERWMSYSRRQVPLSPEVHDRLNDVLAGVDARISSSKDRVPLSARRAMGGPPLTGPFVWPLERLTLTSPFGYRNDPFLGRMRFHDGIDLGAAPGTVVYAAADGEVIHAGKRGLYGLTVVIDHRDGHRTLYGHMENILISQNMRVRRGEPIGQVGSTGRATGPHLHFSVYYRGRAVDPTEVLPGAW